MSVGRSLIDERLVDLAARGKSANEMSEITGLDPAECLMRVRNTLASIDQWSATEMSKLILIQMQDILNVFKDEFDRSPNPRMADAVAKNLKNISEHYMKMRELTLKEEGLLGEMQSQMLKLYIELAYNPVRAYVGKKFNATSQELDEMDAVFVNAMKEADSGTR